MYQQSSIVSFLCFTVVIGGSIVESSPTNSNSKALLPGKNLCGYQHSDDYIHSGSTPVLDEFPWSAMLLYNNGEKPRSVRCSGSLISNRYVLTAASCVKNAHNIIPEIIRLGEYNVKNATDCLDGDCSDPPIDFGIAKIVAHLNYSSNAHHNDIALIRLNGTVKYSDFVRPICVPTSETTLAKPGDTLFITGWGIKKQRDHHTDIKKKISTKLLSNEECKAAHDSYRPLVKDDEICTVELPDTVDISCLGDSGGPVMFSVAYQWHQEGIASYGIGCHSGKPDVHTKVVNYYNWIKDNIEP